MKDPRHIVITGASSGIGAALALDAARPGRRLSLVGRDAGRLEHVAAAARARGAETATACLSVTDRVGMDRCLTAWDDACPVDCVIANAGISGGSGTAAVGSAAAFHDIIDINVSGTLNTVLPLVDRMAARGRGQIAFMSSMAGWRGLPNAPAYSASKVAVRALGEALRPLMAPRGIGVSVIFPGFIKTPLTDQNRFRMPFLMTAEEAAGFIWRGLAAGHARIAFPWPMYLLARLIAALPRPMADWLLMRGPKK